MPNAAPVSPRASPQAEWPAPATPKAGVPTPPVPAANMAQRLRDVEKTASYLGASPAQKSPTPAAMMAVRPQPMRRSSGANAIHRPTTPPPGTLRSAPGASGTKMLAQPKWHCERCHVPVDKEGVVNGTCNLIAGQLYCVRCFKRQVASRQLRLTFWAFGGVLLAGLAFSAVFLTQPLLILLLPIGALAVLTGLIGGGLAGTARLAFVAAGLASIVGSCWGTGVMTERTESRQAVETVQKRAAQVEELIETKNFAQADARIESLDAQSKDRAGHYLSAEHEQKITRLRERLNAQIKATYGDLSAHEYHVLLAVVRAFPDGSDGAQRVHAIHMNDTKLSVSVEKNRDGPSEKDLPPGPQGDVATLQARTLALFIFDSYPFLKDVEVEVTGDKPVRVAYSREQMTQLRMGGMAAPAAVSETQHNSSAEH